MENQFRSPWVLELFPTEVAGIAPSGRVDFSLSPRPEVEHQLYKRDGPQGSHMALRAIVI
jgi:hypothetical protein